MLYHIRANRATERAMYITPQPEKSGVKARCCLHSTSHVYCNGGISIERYIKFPPVGGETYPTCGAARF